MVASGFDGKFENLAVLNKNAPQNTKCLELEVTICRTCAKT